MKEGAERIVSSKEDAKLFLERAQSVIWQEKYRYEKHLKVLEERLKEIEEALRVLEA